MEFRATDDMLPSAPAPAGTPDREAAVAQGHIQVTNLEPGSYRMTCDNETVATATAEQWSKGVAISRAPQVKQEEQFRKLVIAKNAEYFNFWRPENDTYIFGYRKHEQGQNGVEVPRFVPLVEQKDAEIARLRAPVPHKYVLTRENAK